jgi:dipeptidyl aminopeptidase/acylaminoacyl peptidase
MRTLIQIGLALCAAGSLSAQAPAPTAGGGRAGKRALAPTDVWNLKRVADPQVSPDGKWVAYTVTTPDSAKDKNDTDVWMVSWDGAKALRLTSTPENESRPRWSPDGKYLAFMSSRQGATGGQVWLLDRQGGEAVKLTNIKGGVADYAWSPDGTRLALTIGEPDPEDTGDDTAKKKTAKPIVIDRYHFKEDITGYLSNRHSHLYLFAVDTRKLDTLTSGSYDEEQPVWSPDGTKILFTSKRGADPDRNDNFDLYVIDARAGAQARQLTTFNGPDGAPGTRPMWSPDGRQVAYLQASEAMSAYEMPWLAVIPADGGAAKLLTVKLDSPVAQPVWSADGRTITVLVTDDRQRNVARVSVDNGAVEKVTTGERAIGTLVPAPGGNFALLASDPATPAEVYALEGATPRRLTHHNDAWLADVQLGAVEGFNSKSKDGTVVGGLLIKPPGYVAGRRYPFLLRIHGGPVAQDEFGFDFERQVLAAQGYAVAAVNYRGSNGRGVAYQKAIFADWGNKEVVDLMGAVDYLVATGIADPDHMGIGGWSYGGILTDYTIASDTRFKAAISGAGSALQTTMYGIDQYIGQYDNEIGGPWKNPALWQKISRPYYNADKIKTPTMFMGGEKDFNVPIAGSEQMYQALKSLGVETQLIVYPGQFHGLTTPSYLVDRLQRYVAWYGKYVMPPKVQP